jgi:hypothetical protein
MKYFFSKKEEEKINQWLLKTNRLAIKKQKNLIAKTKITSVLYDLFNSSWVLGYPYCGPLGSNYRIIITPNSIGSSVVLEHTIVDEKLDLTNYDTW